MGSLNGRLDRLEEQLRQRNAGHMSEASRTREELSRKAWSGTLNALAHIERAPIDGEAWRFNVERLRGEGAFAIACYVAALAHMEHPDEERAREILEEIVTEQEIEGAPLWAMIDGLVAGMAQIRERIERESRP